MPAAGDSPLILLLDNFCQAQEFRADYQACAICRKPVHLEVKLVIFDRQIDDAAERREPVGFTNRQSVRSLKGRHDPGRLGFSRWQGQILYGKSSGYRSI